MVVGLHPPAARSTSRWPRSPCSAPLTVSTHFRMVGRYYFQILAVGRCTSPPSAVDRRASALAARAAPTARRRRRRRRGRRCRSSVGVARSPCSPGDIADGRERSTAPAAADRPDRSRRRRPIFDAVEAHTAPTDVVAYFRARTMTLYTDRRSIQTTNIDRRHARADYFAQLSAARATTSPTSTPAEARRARAGRGVVGRPLDPVARAGSRRRPDRCAGSVGRMTAAAGRQRRARRRVDVSVVLPVYNERGHLRAEIDRIRAGADGVAVLVRDHRRRRRLRRRLGGRPADDRGHPPDPPRHEPWRRRGPAHRHDGGARAGSSCGPTST